MSSFKRYAREIHDRFGYFASWLPNTRLELGDIGVQDGATFKRMTSLTELGLPFATRSGANLLDFTHTSSSGVTVETDIDAAVGADTGKPGEGKLAGGKLAVKLAEQGAVVFRAANCRVDEISDKVGLGAAVLELFRSGMWDAPWRIIDTVVHAESATIIVSDSAQASLELRAETPLELSSLARLDAGIRVASQAGSVLHFVAAKGLSPLFTLAGIKQSLLAKLLGGKATFGGAAAREPEAVSPAPLEEDPFERVEPLL